MKKIILWFVLGVACTAVAGAIVAVCLLVNFSGSPRLTLTSIPELSLLDDDRVLSITGECSEDWDHVLVFVDHHQQASVPVEKREFRYSLPVSELSEGWHFITVDRPDYQEDSNTEQIYAWIHIIPGQAHVLMPHSLVVESRSDHNRVPRSYRGDCVDNYQPNGRYFGFKTDQYHSSNLAFDAQGIPLVRINNGKNYAYNPTTISQYALSLYNDMLQQSGSERDETRRSFLHVARWLVQNQKENGSFPYSYTFSYKPDLVIPKGFVSGMAQGQLLSVYARAYALSQSDEFLNAGMKCLRFMTSPADSEAGGTAVTLKAFTDQSPALKPFEQYTLFDEYIAQPQTYVLNGNLFALIGLYDWANTVPADYGADQAAQAFEQGCKAVEVLLPYYDYNGYSAYDILPFTTDYDPYFSSSYAHACHIYLLHTLAQVTGNPTFSAYYLRFKSYSDNELYKQTESFFSFEQLQEVNAVGG